MRSPDPTGLFYGNWINDMDGKFVTIWTASVHYIVLAVCSRNILMYRVRVANR